VYHAAIFEARFHGKRLTSKYAIVIKIIFMTLVFIFLIEVAVLPYAKE
jgi:hypothetical protein